MAEFVFRRTEGDDEAEIATDSGMWDLESLAHLSVSHEVQRVEIDAARADDLVAHTSGPTVQSVPRLV